ncbi:DNA glycosylase AlkZ-like family protein [Streptomyces sp. NPDC008121]|uniref:winged helix DNA-binding domain-containing protein n=1 Tax=Streptomyces sp. NPDC008121 TaxID=3364809 RepID=UPI0036ED9DF7
MGSTEQGRRRIDAAERRARLAVRHRLAGTAKARTVEEVAASLVALHATDPATVFLAVGARLRDESNERDGTEGAGGEVGGRGAPSDPAPGSPDRAERPEETRGPEEARGTEETRGPEETRGAQEARDPGETGPVARLERALYEDRSLTRMHGMRHTIFVFPTSLVPAVHASTTRDVAVRERASLLAHLAAGSSYDADWLAETERLVLAELAERGEATGAELGTAVPRLRVQYVYGVGTRGEGPQPLSSRLLRVLGMEGRIARGRPQGAWTSSRFRWSLAPDLPDPSDADAHAALVREWLAAYGPATEADLKWWTGWRVTDVRKALAAVGAQTVELAEGTGYVLPDDTGPVAAPEPWAALLPALDPTAMGWQHRDWFLDPAHRPALFDRSGNIGPTVWWDGRIVGGWAQQPDGEVAWRLLDDVGEEARTAVAAEAARLAAWVGPVRVTPRFRTPLERELAAPGP